MNVPHPDEPTSAPNSEELTLAQIVFQGKQVLVERPDGMDFEQYKALRYIQNRLLKKLFPKAPDKRLSNAMRPHTPMLGARKGFVKVQTQRKAS